MKKLIRVVQIVFGVPWLVFGAQHFMFPGFVATLVPQYFPVKWFWAYLTGAAMIAAGLSFIADIKARLAAVLLGLMLLTFILLIHFPKLLGGAGASNDWTRGVQDIALAAAAFMLARNLSRRDGKNDYLNKIAQVSRYVFAVLLFVFGVSQFLNLDFLTAKIALFMPLRIFWVYLTGAAMIGAGVCFLVNRKAGRAAAFALGTLMLMLNLLLHVPLLTNAPQTPLLWTAAMLDLAITCGVFILAVGSSPETPTEVTISKSAHRIGEIGLI